MKRNISAACAALSAYTVTGSYADERMWTSDSVGTAQLKYKYPENIESLADDFVHDDARNHAVAVHTAAMTEGLRKTYGAGAHAHEIQGVPH